MAAGWGSRYKQTGSAVPTSGGGFGSRYGASTPAIPQTTGGGHHGLLGLVQNFASDTGHAIEGIPAGLVQTVEHPIRTAQQTAQSYETQYGPLLHGDVGKFLHQVYEHPLGPALDALTALSLGATGAERLGLAPEIAREIQLRNPAARLGLDYGKTLDKPLTGGPFQRALKIQAHHLSQRLPADTPLIGETTRFGKELRHLPTQARMSAVAKMRDYAHKTRNLNNEEFAALHLIGRGVHPTDYLNFLKQQGSVEPTMLKVLENPKIINNFEHPNEKIQGAVQAAQKLSKVDAEAKIARGLMTPETAAQRVGLTERMVYGNEKGRAKFYVPDVMPGEPLRNATGARLGGGMGVSKLPSELNYNKGVLARTGRLALHPDLLGPTYLRTLKYGLFDDIHSQLMSHAIRLDEHSLHAGQMPPKGYVFLRKKLVSPKSGKPRPQTISPMLQGISRTKAGLSELVDDHAPDTEGMKFIADHPDSAERVHGDYLVVPERLAKDMAGEFHRSNEAVRLFIEKPTKVWRALVLGARVGFLTNNVIGNHLMWALHAAGPEGLRSYLNAVKRVKGPGVVKSLLNDRTIPPAMRQEFMDEHFPEQVEGTFGSTQAPGSSSFLNRTKGGRTLQKVALGVAPATQAVAEGNLRRSLVEFYLRKSPEFKQVVKEMPGQTKNFETAANQLLKGEGGSLLQRRVSLQVDHALGNYLNLGPIAMVARGVFPFAAWYKAILSVTGHLALDTPGRTAILVKLGQIGTTSAQNELGKIFGGAENVPSWLLGSVMPIGGKKVLGTTGLNPFETINQLGQGAGAAVGIPGSGSLGQAFSNLGPNPVLLGLAQAIAGKNLYTGKTLNTPGGLAGSIGSQFVGGLPETGLANALLGHGRNTTTYGKQSGKAAILQYLGAPVKTLKG